MLSDSQQSIYNQYLHALGEANDRPYRKRSNFDNIRDDISSVLIRLEHFFSKYQYIRPYDFFLAGLRYSGAKYLPISYYLKRCAIASYKKYRDSLLTVDPDSDGSISSFEEGIKFIEEFVSSQDKLLSDYTRLNNRASIPYWLMHLKEQHISFYHLHALGIDPSVVESGLRDIMIQEFDKKFEATRQAYSVSGKLKTLGDSFKSKLNS